MGFQNTMDIRGIAWAGYFFDPGAVQPPMVYGCPPILEGEFVSVDAIIKATELKPIIGDSLDPSSPPPYLSVRREIPDLDADELKPKISSGD